MSIMNKTETNLTMKTINSTPWVEKYRPNQLIDVVNHAMILDILRYFLNYNDKQLPHLFFYGPPGTGKTSTILSCAREIYGLKQSTMVLHLNASDERGVDVVRKQIIQFASTSSIFGSKTPHKLVILDEADSMTESAQIALRDVLVSYDTRFCLIGNCQNAIISALQSHVVKLMFSPISADATLSVGETILKAENIEYDREGLHSIYRTTGGDLRKFINVLQAVSLRSGKVVQTEVCNVLHYWKPNEIADFIDFLKIHTIKESLDEFNTSLDGHSHNFTSWLKELFHYLLNSLPESQIAEFVDQMSVIEYNASFMVYTDIQRVCLICCCHKFARM